MYLFSGGESKEEKVEQLTLKINKVDPIKATELFPDLEAYLPEFGEIVFRETAGVTSWLVSNMKLTNAIHSSTFRLLNKISECERTRKSMFQRKGFVESLIKHTVTNNSDLYSLIYNLLFDDPQATIDLIESNRKIVVPLLNTTISTQSIESGTLLHRIFSLNPSIQAILTPYISPNLRSMPITTAIDFMLASPELERIIPSEEIESWIMNHQSMTVLDVDSACRIYTNLWNKEVSLVMLGRSTVPPKFEHVEWLHTMTPQDMDYPEDRIGQLCSDFMASWDQKSGSMEGFFFIKAYVFSFVDPVKIPDEIMSIFTARIDEITVQMFLRWAVKFKFKFSDQLILRLLSTLSTPSTGFKVLLRALINCIAAYNQLAYSIVFMNPSLTADTLSEAQIDKSSVFMYPHTQMMVESASGHQFLKFEDSMMVVGHLISAITQK